MPKDLVLLQIFLLRKVLLGMKDANLETVGLLSFCSIFDFDTNYI